MRADHGGEGAVCSGSRFLGRGRGRRGGGRGLALASMLTSATASPRSASSTPIRRRRLPDQPGHRGPSRRRARRGPGEHPFRARRLRCADGTAPPGPAGAPGGGVTRSGGQRTVAALAALTGRPCGVPARARRASTQRHHRQRRLIRGYNYEVRLIPAWFASPGGKGLWVLNFPYDGGKINLYAFADSPAVEAEDWSYPLRLAHGRTAWRVRPGCSSYIPTRPTQRLSNARRPVSRALRANAVRRTRMACGFAISGKQIRRHAAQLAVTS